jgi:hypothetical protein
VPSEGTLEEVRERLRQKWWIEIQGHLPAQLQKPTKVKVEPSTLGAHLGMTKTLQRISKVFHWPRMRADVLNYVRRCQACQRAKPAQNTIVGLHSSQVVTKPMESFY